MPSGPQKRGWSSGKEARSGSGAPYTEAHTFSDRAIAASQPPLRSTSGPKISAGRRLAEMRTAKSRRRTTSGATRSLTVRTRAGPASGCFQSSMRIDRYTGPAGS